MSPTPFPPYVRELTINNQGSEYEEIEEDWTNSELLAILPALNEVQKLSLQHLTADDMLDEFIACMINFSANVDTLELDTLDFAGGLELRTLLFGYPKLSSLMLKSVVWTKLESRDEREPEPETKIDIRTLVMEDTLEDADIGTRHRGIECCLSGWKRGSPLRFAVQELRWTSHASRRLCSALSEVLDEAGQTLERATIAFYPHTLDYNTEPSTEPSESEELSGPLVDLPDQFHMLACTRLRILELVCPRDGVTEKQCAWAPTLLERVHSKQLQEIRLVFGSCGFREFFLSFVDWERIDESLARLRRVECPKLSAIFQIGKMEEVSNEYTRQAILARIPKTLSAGTRVGMAVAQTITIGNRTVSREVVNWENGVPE